MSRLPDLETSDEEASSADAAEVQPYAANLERIAKRLREDGALGVVLIDASALEGLERRYGKSLHG